MMCDVIRRFVLELKVLSIKATQQIRILCQLRSLISFFADILSRIFDCFKQRCVLYIVSLFWISQKLMPLHYVTVFSLMTLKVA